LFRGTVSGKMVVPFGDSFEESSAGRTPAAMSSRRVDSQRE
jgi:hypothetical protein